MSTESQQRREWLHSIIFGADTPLGKALASVIMIVGYGIIAVPTGIVSVELAGAARMGVTASACPGCGAQGHDADAKHYKFCSD